MRRTRRQITFLDRRDAETLALGMIGGGNTAMDRHFRHKGVEPPSGGQISYRLAMAKELYGLEHGFRVSWRRGESKFFKMVKKDILGVLVHEIQRTLPQKLVHVTPKTVKK